MIAGIIAGLFVFVICVFAFALCRAASDGDMWDNWEEDDRDD